MSRDGLSLVDVAEIILRETKEPQNIYDLFDAVCTQKNIKKDAKANVISQFYADITTSAKFVYTGDNTWDLKDNQKIELWEKDGSFYKEYTVVEIPEEYLEPKRTIRPGKAAKVEPVIEEVVEAVVVEPVVEEVIVEPVVEEVVEAAVEVVATDGKEIDAEVEVEEDIFEEEFDEDKYNEYMDTYEDKYEK